MNDDRVVDMTTQAVAAQFGDTVLEQLEGQFGTEDFSYFSERIPSCQLLVGASQPGRDDRVHNSDYQPDERCIGLVVAALSRATLRILS